MSDARLKLPNDLSGLTRSEWEMILHEAMYSQIDEDIVRYHIINRMAQCDAAAEIDRVRMTIYRRLHKHIYPRAREVAHKINII